MISLAGFRDGGSMDIVTLPGSIGVEVEGVDLRGMADFAAGWTTSHIDQLRRALEERHLLVVRGGVLSGEEQVAFVARFGPLCVERGLWGYVSNVREGGIVPEGPLLFHSDFAFTPFPVRAISLHAIDLPAGGTSTLFADAVRAAACLPADLRSRLVGRRVLNLYDLRLPDDRPHRASDADAGSPRCAVPVLGRHPGSGHEVVCANELHSDHIVGLPEGESRALLDDLFGVLYDPAHVYEHRWRSGDLLLWDNVALHHGRRDVPRREARTLQRVTIGPYTPGELWPNLAEQLANPSAQS